MKDIDKPSKKISSPPLRQTKVSGSRKRVAAGICSFRLSKNNSAAAAAAGGGGGGGGGFSPMNFLRRLSAKVVRALRFVSSRRRRTSPKVVSSSSSSSSSNLVRSRSYISPNIDSHRTEAIEDCIQFINSSSFQRSNSVSTKNSS